MKNQDELQLLKADPKSSGQTPVTPGTRSINIANLGKLQTINANTMVPVTQLVNLGVDIVCDVLFPNGLLSDAYLEIKKKVNSFPVNKNRQEIEFQLMRIALEIMAIILKKPENSNRESIYTELLKVIDFVSDNGKEISFQWCVIEAIREALNDPQFASDLLNKIE